CDSAEPALHLAGELFGSAEPTGRVKRADLIEKALLVSLPVLDSLRPHGDAQALLLCTQILRVGRRVAGGELTTVAAAEDSDIDRRRRHFMRVRGFGIVVSSSEPLEEHRLDAERLHPFGDGAALLAQLVHHARVE